MSVLQKGVIFLNKFQARKAIDEYGENNLFRPTIKRSANSFKISCNYKGCPFKCLMCKHKDDKVKCTFLLEKHIHSIGNIPVERKRCSCILTHTSLVNKITPILMANPKATAKDLKQFLLSEGYEVPSSSIYSVKKEILDKMPKIITENEPINKILKTLDKIHPIKLSEDDDNIGLILEPSQLLIKPPYRLLLTYEINDSVVDEAIQNKIYIIVSYKPLINNEIKKLNYENRVSRILLNCITNDIGIYIYHTSCDNVINGVNDCLVIGIGGINPKPIEPNQLESDSGCGRICDIVPDISFDNLVTRIKQFYGINYIQIAVYINIFFSFFIYLFILETTK